MSSTLVPFGLQAMTVIAKILYTFLIQILEPIGRTILTIKESLSPRSVINNHAQTDTTTSCASGLWDIFGEKTTQAHISHGHELFYLKNAGSNTTSIPSLNLRNWSSLHSFLLLPTHLAFSHSHFQNPVLAPQPHHSMSEEVPGYIYTHKSLQHLFKPYPKLTPYLHPYLHLYLYNPYYVIKLMFNTSTNPQLYC